MNKATAPAGDRSLTDCIAEGLVAGAAGAVLSGVPSTVHALVTGAPVLDATAAAGELVLSGRRPRWARVVAGGAAHVAISGFWGVVLALALPRRSPRHGVAAGVLGGLAIAALDLGVIGRRVPAIRSLPSGPQIADHVAFGAVVGGVLSLLRAGDRTTVAGGRPARRG